MASVLSRIGEIRHADGAIEQLREALTEADAAHDAELAAKASAHTAALTEAKQAADDKINAMVAGELELQARIESLQAQLTAATNANAQLVAKLAASAQPMA